MTLVIVAGNDVQRSREIMAMLVDFGYAVTGPARTASRALQLAADAPVSAAVISEDLAGNRDSRELAKLLSDRCAIPTLVIDHQYGRGYERRENANRAPFS